jgi:hypothetical protein
MSIMSIASRIVLPMLALFTILSTTGPALRADDSDLPPLSGTALEKLLGTWHVEATFFDAAGVPHFESAIFDVAPDTALKRGNSWVVGIWTGTRTDGSDAFDLRFHYRVDRVTKQNIRIEFGDIGPNQALTVLTEGTDDGGNTLTWRGTLGPESNVSFVETIKFIGRNSFTINASSPDENGTPLLSGTARRL